MKGAMWFYGPALILCGLFILGFALDLDLRFAEWLENRKRGRNNE